MPLRVIETTDPLVDQVSFRTSAVYEMLISLTALLAPHRFSSWTRTVQERLGDPFFDDLRTLVAPYLDGVAFVEFGTDYADHNDVPGFIEHVRQMPRDQFAFYMLGRTFTREELKASHLKPDAVRRLCVAVDELGCSTLTPLQWLDDVVGYQQALCDLWLCYWEKVFGDEIEGLRSHWMHGLHRKEAIFERDGSGGLLKHIIGKSELPPNHPPDYPLETVVFIPIYFTVKRVYMFFGYGNVTILFDSQLSESREAQIAQARAAALSTLKAMSDENRLKILRLIVLSAGTMSGKKLAEKLCLSPSAVSRHLAQLKEGNLISEQSEDNRTITYTLNKDTLTALPDAIMDYLYS